MPGNPDDINRLTEFLKKLNPSHVVMRDKKSCCAVLLDDDNRRTFASPAR